MKKTILAMLALALAAVIFASGCNTVRGMGRDLEEGGKRLQDVSTR